MKISKNYIAIAIILTFLTLGYFLNNQRVRNIRKNHSFTIGKITKVHTGGVAFDISLEYEYVINNIIYSRTVEIPANEKSKFRKRNGINQYVLVMYSRFNPEKSLVNLSNIYPVNDTLTLLEAEKVRGFY